MNPTLHWKKAAMLALLADAPFCWLTTQQPASIAGMELSC